MRKRRQGRGRERKGFDRQPHKFCVYATVLNLWSQAQWLTTGSGVVTAPCWLSVKILIASAYTG